MNLSLRRKLVLAITIPLLITYVGLLAWDYARQKDAAMKQMQDLATERAASAAASLDARLSAVMQLVDSTANVLTTRQNLAEAQARAILAVAMRQNPWINAAAIALEPGDPSGRGAIGIDDAGSAAGGLRFIIRDADSADRYTDADWYTRARQSGQGTWTGPVHRAGHGDEWFCTFSAPFFHGEGNAFRGVFAATMRAENLQRLRPGASDFGRRRLFAPRTEGPVQRRIEQRLEGERSTTDERPDHLPGEAARQATSRPATRPEPVETAEEASVRPSDYVIVDQAGTIISHPDAAMIGRASIFRIARERGMTELADAGSAALAGKSGVVRVRGAADLFPAGSTPDGYHWIAFAPIPSTGWTFAATLSESTVMDPILDRLWKRGAFLLAGLVVLIAVAMLVSIRISRPIERMAGAVRDLGTGNLDVQVEGITSHDEIGQLARGFNSMVRQLKAHVQALTEQSAARARVESELRIARQIQADLLPRTFPPFPDRTEFDLYAVNEPAMSVGGDFYDFFFTPQGRLALVVGDVSGKGVPAALLMAVARTIIRNLAGSGLSPAEIVERANALLLQDTSSSMFLTLFLAEYEPASGRVVYVNAGHPPPFRVIPGTGATSFGEANAPLLGAAPSSEIGPFAQAEERLEPGELLVIYTDGVTEARSLEDRILGETGLEAVLDETTPGQTPKALTDRIVAAVDKYQHGVPADDVTVLVLERRA